jgi:hypothetical protein
MKYNKQLINDEMTLVKITSSVSEPKITIAMVMKTLTEFMIEQRKFNDEQKRFNKDQKRFNKEQKRFNKDQKQFNQYVINVFKKNNLAQ